MKKQKEKDVSEKTKKNRRNKEFFKRLEEEGILKRGRGIFVSGAMNVTIGLRKVGVRKFKHESDNILFEKLNAFEKENKLKLYANLESNEVYFKELKK